MPQRSMLAALLAATLLAACGGEDRGTDVGGAGEAGTATDRLVMGDNFFQPGRWIIPGDGGTFTVVNEGAALHNLTIEAAGIDEDVPAGEEVEVEIELDPGEYEMVCVYHIAQGMTGTVVVE